MLRGSDSEQTTTGPDDSTDYKYYILSAKNSRVAFYYGSDNGAPVTNAAHKAYLAVPMAQASGVNAFFIDGTDDTDDIDDINDINVINDINDLNVLNNKKPPPFQMERRAFCIPASKALS